MWILRAIFFKIAIKYVSVYTKWEIQIMKLKIKRELKFDIWLIFTIRNPIPYDFYIIIFVIIMHTRKMILITHSFTFFVVLCIPWVFECFLLFDECEVHLSLFAVFDFDTNGFSHFHFDRWSDLPIDDEILFIFFFFA